MTQQTVLPGGLPIPVPGPDGLDAPFWEATRHHELVVQRCQSCERYQWGPEWICHHCLSFDLGWATVEPHGKIFSWERVWYPTHPALKEACPYLIILVELPHADNIRMVGNLLGDPEHPVEIGTDVEAVFEDHDDTEPAYTLVQWRVAG